MIVTTPWWCCGWKWDKTTVSGQSIRVSPIKTKPPDQIATKTMQTMMKTRANKQPTDAAPLDWCIKLTNVLYTLLGDDITQRLSVVYIAMICDAGRTSWHWSTIGGMQLTLDVHYHHRAHYEDVQITSCNWRIIYIAVSHLSPQDGMSRCPIWSFSRSRLQKIMALIGDHVYRKYKSVVS